MDDPVFADAQELLAYQRETSRLADENLALTLTNFDNIWPWRYLRYRTTAKLVKAGREEVERRLAVGERGFAIIFNGLSRRSSAS